MLAFALGALPLIVYNIEKPLATFRGNTSWDTSDLAGKGRLLAATANGSALFGWLSNEDWQTQNPHLPQGALEAASARISALAGHPRHSLLLYAFGLALLLAPLARGHALRAILFALLAMALPGPRWPSPPTPEAVYTTPFSSGRCPKWSSPSPLPPPPGVCALPVFRHSPSSWQC